MKNPKHFHGLFMDLFKRVPMSNKTAGTKAYVGAFSGRWCWPFMLHLRVCFPWKMRVLKSTAAETFSSSSRGWRNTWGGVIRQYKKENRKSNDEAENYNDDCSLLLLLLELRTTHSHGKSQSRVLARSEKRINIFCITNREMVRKTISQNVLYAADFPSRLAVMVLVVVCVCVCCAAAV